MNLFESSNLSNRIGNYMINEEKSFEIDRSNSYDQNINTKFSKTMKIDRNKWKSKVTPFNELKSNDQDEESKSYNRSLE